MLVFLALACTSSGDSGDTGASYTQRTEVLTNLATDVAGAAYADFATESAALTTAAEAFCAAPSVEGLGATRDAWWASREPFKRAELVHFGPLEDEPWRVGPKVDFWPVRASVVDDILAGEQPLSVEGVSALGGAGRGFPVLEYLLWPPDGDALEAFAVARRCAYLTGAAGDLQQQAEVLRDAWIDYTPGIVHPSQHPDGPYASEQAVLDEWVNRMFFTVEDLRFEKLGGPLGDGTGGNAAPLSAESPTSGRSLTDARDALAGVRLAWDGESDRLKTLVPADRAAFVPALEANLDKADAALLAVPEPLTDAIVSDPRAVEAAQEALRDLQVSLQVDLAQALSVTITFNDNDGD